MIFNNGQCQDKKNQAKRGVMKEEIKMQSTFTRQTSSKAALHSNTLHFNLSPRFAWWNSKEFFITNLNKPSSVCLSAGRERHFIEELTTTHQKSKTNFLREDKTYGFNDELNPELS
jgi:hypothetical protein